MSDGTGLKFHERRHEMDIFGRRTFTASRDPEVSEVIDWLMERAEPGTLEIREPHIGASYVDCVHWVITVARLEGGEKPARKYLVLPLSDV